MKFEELKLSENILKAITAQGYAGICNSGRGYSYAP